MRIKISIANKFEKEELYKLRHEVYATELGQYEEQSDSILKDKVDVRSDYITATIDDVLVGFVGITPPTSPCYSVDKYVSREKIPVTYDDNLYEFRALTVKDTLRGSSIVACLIYACYRWVSAKGGTNIIAIGRCEVLDMYLRLGFKQTGHSFSSGAVNYELITATTTDFAEKYEEFKQLIIRLKRIIDWQLDIQFDRPADCYHGGAFFDAIGDQFDNLSKIDEIISADVLDAWFPPAPTVLQHVQENLAWAMRTSPPTQASGLAQVIANDRGVSPDNILTGGGSSDLIFLALTHWLNPNSRVLILDPTYGEYNHVFENVIQCKVERFQIHEDDGFRVNLTNLKSKLSEGFDLFVWVNPNSPTGLHVQKEDVLNVLKDAPCKRVWIDETYIEYAGREQSLENFAVKSNNIIICKSMSKVYALSGIRVAYLCSSAHQLESLRLLTPPWSVSLPGQIAATYAIQAHDYYQQRYDETHDLREELLQGLRQLGIERIILGTANFLLFFLPSDGINSANFIKACRELNLYLRDVSNMGGNLGEHAIRIAVKDRTTNHRMLSIMADVLTHTW